MNTKTSLIILVIAAIVVVGFILLRGPAEAPIGEDSMMEGESMEDDGSMMEDDGDSMDGEAMMEENVVTYSDSGYSPSEIRVNAGDTVTWRNESSADMWTASAVHPTHTVYPGSDISLCTTAEAVGIFDSCQRISSGGEYSFRFDEAGTWGYHNHINASHTGRVIVE